MIIGGDETTMWGTVERYEHPLVKFADVHFAKDDEYFPGGGTLHGEIVNVTSSHFIAVLKNE